MSVPQLVFNLDGTIDPEQLVELPDDLRERVTSPEFIEHAREQIRTQERQKQRAEEAACAKSRVARFYPTTRTIKIHPQLGLSGRQLRKARKLARRAGGMA